MFVVVVLDQTNDLLVLKFVVDGVQINSMRALLSLLFFWLDLLFGYLTCNSRFEKSFFKSVQKRKFLFHLNN